MKAWLIALFSILIAAAIAGVIVLFVLRKNSNQGPVGPQGPIGEQGFPGERGPQGVQGPGSQGPPGPNFDLVKFGSVQVSGIPISPLVFQGTNSMTLSYEILSQRMDPTTVRRNITIKAAQISVIPLPLIGTTQQFEFQFLLPATIGGSTFVSIGPTPSRFVGTAVAANALKGPVAALWLAAMAPQGANGIVFSLAYNTGAQPTTVAVQVGQVLICNFQITFWHDDNLPQ